MIYTIIYIYIQYPPQLIEDFGHAKSATGPRCTSLIFSTVNSALILRDSSSGPGPIGIGVPELEQYVWIWCKTSDNGYLDSFNPYLSYLHPVHACFIMLCLSPIDT